jgi:hypothetical protein
MSDDPLDDLSEEEHAAWERLAEAMDRAITEIEAIAVNADPRKRGGPEETRRVWAKSRVLVAEFRVEVDRALKCGIETPLAWHILGMGSEGSKERLRYFARELECWDFGRGSKFVQPGPRKVWAETHGRADCLYGIGRAHAVEGDLSLARDFLMRALRLAQQAEEMRDAAEITNEDGLEGRIAVLLVQLPG